MLPFPFSAHICHVEQIRFAGPGVAQRYLKHDVDVAKDNPPNTEARLWTPQFGKSLESLLNFPELAQVRRLVSNFWGLAEVESDYNGTRANLECFSSAWWFFRQPATDDDVVDDEEDDKDDIH